jgi:hypothetical protein
MMILILCSTHHHLQLCIDLAFRTSFMLFIGCVTFCCYSVAHLAALWLPIFLASELLDFNPLQDKSIAVH